MPKSLGQLILMCPGLSGFRIWEPGGLSHLKEITDQNSGSSGVVLKEDSSLLAMLQILLKILVEWTMRHLPLWVLPHIILSIDDSWWVFSGHSDSILEPIFYIWKLSMYVSWKFRYHYACRQALLLFL